MAKDEAKDSGLGEASVDELRYVQQVYQNQYAVMGNSINMALQELQDLNSVQKTLENANIIEGKEILTGLGADSFMVSSVKSAKTAMMSVGGGYLVEMDNDSAKQRIAKIIQKRNEGLNKLMKNRKELEAALIEISYRLNNLR